jgi:hypothetical protein
MAIFRRVGDECVARFAPQEVQVLRQCAAHLAAMLADEPDHDDPAIERLFPDVYPEDPAQQEEFRRLTQDDLKSAKLEQAKTMLVDLIDNGGVRVSEFESGILDDGSLEAEGIESSREVRLPEDRADLWLRALTDVRLILGTRLGVEDDTDIYAEIDAAVGRNPTSARVSQLTVYAFLTRLQESLVEAMMGADPGGFL